MHDNAFVTSIAPPSLHSKRLLASSADASLRLVNGEIRESDLLTTAEATFNESHRAVVIDVTLASHPRDRLAAS